jgi:hypothetical protein
MGAVVAHGLVGVRRAAALLAALVLALAAPAAYADGDPASDVLIGARVFYPYQVKLPRESTQALEKTIKTATEKGYPVRVALIANESDLGSAALLYRKPQIYAKFLAEELGNFNRDWLLVVMPNGYGIYHCKPKKRAEGYTDPCEGTLHTAQDERALASVPPPKRSEDFAASAEVAVRALAERHGASFGPPLALLGGVAALALALAAGVVIVLRRRSAVRAQRVGGGDDVSVGGVDGDHEAAGAQQSDRALQQE